MKYISTRLLAIKHDLKPNELADKLEEIGLTERRNNKKVLTVLGKERGGTTRNSTKFGDYIVWPEDISFKTEPKLIGSTEIGKHFNVSAPRLNLILSEIGWIKKTESGWAVTKLGKTVGGSQIEYENTGTLCVHWPESILNNPSLIHVFSENTGKPNVEDSKLSKQKQFQKNTPTVPPLINFRERYEATHRAKDGHYVRSRAEVIIDDTLYDYGLVHAYEKKVPIEEEMYTDFYLPAGRIYIEFWGMENDPKYAERKREKMDLYRKYQLKLIELNDNDILNLDDHLPKKLLKYNIKVY